MKQFFIEGLIIPRRARAQSKASAERVSLSVWAETPKDALREAQKSVNALEWIEGPELTLSEEQRMRAGGAPELFNYSKETAKPARKK